MRRGSVVLRPATTAEKIENAALVTAGVLYSAVYYVAVGLALWRTVGG